MPEMLYETPYGMSHWHGRPRHGRCKPAIHNFARVLQGRSWFPPTGARPRPRRRGPMWAPSIWPCLGICRMKCGQTDAIVPGILSIKPRL
jgi:hypothetical protein